MSGVPELNWAGAIIKAGEGYGGRMYEEEEAERERKRQRCTLVITESDLATIFENGSRPRAEATKLLQAFTGASRATCYRALDLKGRFARHLRDENGMLAWRG
jgi:hypothetical protein